MGALCRCCLAVKFEDQVFGEFAIDFKPTPVIL
jgi:hypothetical protein